MNINDLFKACVNEMNSKNKIIVSICSKTFNGFYETSLDEIRIKGNSIHFSGNNGEFDIVCHPYNGTIEYNEFDEEYIVCSCDEETTIAFI